MDDTVRKRSVTIAGHRTSFSLEDAFWQELVGIAERRDLTLAELVVEIDSEREGNLSSALRLYILRDLQNRIRGQGRESLPDDGSEPDEMV
ncbi:ribbon-helix-helix domain-containing protein [Thalassospira sp. SM2505]